MRNCYEKGLCELLITNESVKWHCPISESILIKLRLIERIYAEENQIGWEYKILVFKYGAGRLNQKNE